MDQQRKRDLAAGLSSLADSFWAGEAEICREFWSVPRGADEQAHWLRLQVYKEMFGSGLVGHSDGIIRAFIEKLSESLPNAQTKTQRDDFERDIRVLAEEFNHYRLFADILESATGEPVRLEKLRAWQLPEDKKLQQVRQWVRTEHGHVGEAAIGFTEGGGASFFFEGRKLSGDPIAEQIANACEIVFQDETEHGEHGATELARELDTETEWAKARELVTAICQQRLRMRYEMFGLPINEVRIREIAEGNIEPLRMHATTSSKIEGLKQEIQALGQRFWAGEAEIARNFLTAGHPPEDHVHWLRHQCYRELRGPGLLERPHSRTQWLIDMVGEHLPVAESKSGRHELEYQLESLRQEFTHFRLFADILEDITGAPVLMGDLDGLRLPSDARIENMRSQLLAEDERLTNIAYSFAEGGGAGIFHAGAALETDDPLLVRIKNASRVIYDDEVGHGEHGAENVDSQLQTEQELATLRRMVIDICTERLRMRSEMYGIEPDEARIAEIARGQIDPLPAI